MNIALRLADAVAKKHPLFERCVPLPEAAKKSDEIMHHSVMS
jgi:hypothetical protein